MKVGDVLFDRFKIVKSIGSGSFGDVYKGTDMQDNNHSVAVKVEKKEPAKSRLESERDVYTQVQGVGVPEVKYYGELDNQVKILVMSYLGPCLEDLFDFCGRKLSNKTVAMLGIQFINQLEHIHASGIIHRDIKPDNFLIGLGKDKSKVFIIDFGLSKSFYSNKDHIEYRNNKNFTGTYRYSSIRNHKGIEQSRRDDLESVGYMLVYFSKGNLPWQGLKIADKAERNRQIHKKKRITRLQDLCEGLPTEIYSYLRYARMLRFTQEPDYSYLRNLFYSILQRE
ncbi:unnamed protein product, partial [marine sediment metagenome]